MQWRHKQQPEHSTAKLSSGTARGSPLSPPPLPASISIQLISLHFARVSARPSRTRSLSYSPRLKNLFSCRPPLALNLRNCTPQPHGILPARRPRPTRSRRSQPTRSTDSEHRLGAAGDPGDNTAIWLRKPLPTRIRRSRRLGSGDPGPPESRRLRVTVPRAPARGAPGAHRPMGGQGRGGP